MRRYDDEVCVLAGRREILQRNSYYNYLQYVVIFCLDKTDKIFEKHIS